MVKDSKAAIKNATKRNIDSQKKLEQRLEKERRKQLEDSSSSTSTIESTESIISFCEAEKEEEIYISDNIYETDTESQSDEEPEYVQRKSLLPETDFFQVFGEIPSVDKISEDTSEVSILFENFDTLEVALEEDSKRDVGKFVNPLTGLDLSVESVSSKSINQSVSEELEEGEAEENLEEEDMSETSELLLLDDALELKDEKEHAIREDTLEAFLKMHMETEMVKTEDIDWEALMYQEEAKHMQKKITKFLTELINKVVELAEYISPERFLLQNLDKRKVLSELCERLQHYYAEKGKCAFLNRQVVTYYRRKKHFRAIMEDNPKKLLRDKKNLETAKEYLDKILTKETKLKNTSAEMQDDLRREYNKLKQDAETQIQIFETKVKNHLCRDNWPKLHADIDRLFLTMRKYRQEVSEVRFSLLLQQHTEAKLMKLICQMEDLGNGLNMKSFTTLQAENQTLDKKIEERNADLNKLYLRCHNNIHTLAHYKENQKMLHDSIKTQRKILNNLTDNQLALREHLFSLKLQRNRIHGKIKKLSVQGGLLDKPALMFDYDNTVKVIGEKKESVDLLKQILFTTQRKIDTIIDHCSNVKIE